MGSYLALVSEDTNVRFGMSEQSTQNTSFPELKLIDYPIELGILFLCILGIGIVITWISTHLATQRFLNLKTDQLYY